MINNIKDNNNYKNLYILGDIHSNFSIINYYLKSLKIENSIIIQIGDFGLGFKEKEERKNLLELNYKLLENNCMLYAIRGNHDNPEYFNNLNLYSNIILLKDWS